MLVEGDPSYEEPHLRGEREVGDLTRRLVISFHAGCRCRSQVRIGIFVYSRIGNDMVASDVSMEDITRCWSWSGSSYHDHVCLGLGRTEDPGRMVDTFSHIAAHRSRT